MSGHAPAAPSTATGRLRRVPNDARVRSRRVESRTPEPSAIAFSAAIGALAGASLGARRGRLATVAGATIGGAALAASDSVARARQRPGEIPALPQRIAVSGALAAPVGGLAGALGAGAMGVGTAFGALAGLIGLRPQKVAM